MSDNSPKSPSLSPIRIREEAMATHFEILICHAEPSFAKGIAGMAFREIDRMEELLSRFRDGSDIARINQLKAGETILLSNESHHCILQAMEIQTMTGGRFDIATGGYMDLLRDLEGNPVESNDVQWSLARRVRGQGKLKIDPTEPRVNCIHPGLQLDLGGVGKGYALEVVAGLMEEMEINSYLLSAGGSTILAQGCDENGNPWMAVLSGESQSLEIELKDQCLSSSGFEVKGAHIISNGEKAKTTHWKRVWVKGPNATLVDGLSTAVFLMDRKEIQELLSVFEGNVEIWTETHAGKIESH